MCAVHQVLSICKKVLPVSCPQPVCHPTYPPWPEIVYLFQARERLVSDIPAGEGKIDNFLLQCTRVSDIKKIYPVFVIYELIRKGSVAKLRCSVCKYFCILCIGFLFLYLDPV
jgi:hypothetical protein